jgi:hypothetical protein
MKLISRRYLRASGTVGCLKTSRGSGLLYLDQLAIAFDGRIKTGF